MKRALLVALGFSLTACAATPSATGSNGESEGSYVEALQPSDIALLTQAIVDELADPLPPASSTVRLVPPAADAPDLQLTPALTAGLMQAGYGVATVAGTDVHDVRYWVAPVDGGLLLRLKVDGGLLSCFYTRDANGALSLASACTTLQALQ